jgi:hypothetical protein
MFQPMKSVELSDMNFRLADSFVNQTGCNLFLTGKAGSGKTTFLHYITSNTHKKFVVVAPTGVAAINAGGMTIHSFFQLPIGMFIPDTSASIDQDSSNAIYPHHMLLRKIRFSKQKRKLMQQLELLIIDEVSMVRADVMDALDILLKHLRKNHREAFGGVQVLMIGDLFQLPPVVKDTDRNLLYSYYSTPYFFSSRIIKKSAVVRIELEKVHRQRDVKFIGLLNKIRHNQVNDADLTWLNAFYNPDFKPPESEKYITLCSHHYKADAINAHELKNLPGRLYRHEAVISGDFNESAIPAEQTLLLKKNAQIMFIRNDSGEERRYYNGKIGVISEIDEEEIGIDFPGEEGTLYIEKVTWKNIRYSLDESTGNIVEKELGTFSQFPVRLAWAITIHKSQGLTFERAIIDAGESFTSGQVYVALSRLRGLEGLVLRTPIERSCIISDRALQEFVIRPEENQQELLEAERNNYLRTLLLRSMEWEFFLDPFHEFIELYREKEVAYREEALYIGKCCLQKGIELKEVSDKFRNQALKYFRQKDYPVLSERMFAAYEYFKKNLEEEIIKRLNDHYGQMEKRSRMGKYLKLLQNLRQVAATRLTEIRQARDLFEGLSRGEKVEGLLNSFKETKKESVQKAVKIKKPPNPRKGDSHRMSLEMYQEGKTVAEIARERMLHPGTIESHLVHFILEGMLDVHSFVSKEKFVKIFPEIEKDPGRSLTALKQAMGDQYSYNEIRAVMNHYAYLNKNGDSS